MNFYTVILRKSASYWVSLCLENGLVGQGETPEQAIDKLKEAIESFSEVYNSEENVYNNNYEGTYFMFKQIENVFQLLAVTN